MPSYGGGVYCAADTSVVFTECLFQNNAASVPLAGTAVNNRVDPYLGFGGGIAAEQTAGVTFVDCNLVGNVSDTGGGLYVADSNDTVQVIDSRIRANRALRGGGITIFGGAVSLTGCEVKNNGAVRDANDTSEAIVVPIGAGLLLSSTTASIQDCNIAGNISNGSGGGIYLRGQNHSEIFNCLIRGNLALRDGGGISSNWYAAPTIRCCTFFGNASPGMANDPNNSGIGGAVFSGYYSDCNITDSILWVDYARRGAELAVGTGFELDPQCGHIGIAYSDIWAGPNDVSVDLKCQGKPEQFGVEYGKGILHKDPLFVSGLFGDFFLSNRGAGQGATSPCVDAGDQPARDPHLFPSNNYTTRTDRVPDTGIVDLGYHQKFFEKCRFCDLEHDGLINFKDFVRFAEYWRNSGCSEANGWCGGANVTFDGKVDANDLALFAECWLVRDTKAPTPDPAEWEIGPELVGTISVQMTAKEELDDCGLERRVLLQVCAGQRSRQWLADEPGLRRYAAASRHAVRLSASRPAIRRATTTKWSVVRFAGAADTTPPAPAPFILTVAGGVLAVGHADGAGRLRSQWRGVLLRSNTPGAHASGWIATPTYTDINLLPSTHLPLPGQGPGLVAPAE